MTNEALAINPAYNNTTESDSNLAVYTVNNSQVCYQCMSA